MKHKVRNQRLKLKKRYLLLGVMITLVGSTLIFNRYYPILPLSEYFLLPEIPEPTTTDRILVVSPHEDDETLGAAGFIARAVSNQAMVQVVVVTNGSLNGSTRQRHQETVRAMGDMGLPENQITFFDYPDGHLKQRQLEFNAQLTQVMEQFRPTIVLSTLPQDIHPDHATVGRGVDAVVNNLQIHPAVYQFLIHYHHFPRPEGYLPDNYLLPPTRLLTSNFLGQKFTLTKNEEQKKYTALKEYRSQFLPAKNILQRNLLLSFVRRNELFWIK
jgi:LmbE family N-acetylglucosaminyl deacetylase